MELSTNNITSLPNRLTPCILIPIGSSLNYKCSECGDRADFVIVDLGYSSEDLFLAPDLYNASWFVCQKCRDK